MPVHLLLVCDNCGKATPSGALRRDHASALLLGTAMEGIGKENHCTDCMPDEVRALLKGALRGAVEAEECWQRLIAAHAKADEARAAKLGAKPLTEADAAAAIMAAGEKGLAP